MLAFGTDLINGAALWKIILASLVGGAGVAIAFGLLLLGLERAQHARSGGSAGMGRVGGYSLATLAAVFCLAAVVFGVFAMVKKPSSSSSSSKSKSASIPARIYRPPVA